jgi:CheY-like chemotaxis protein
MLSILLIEDNDIDAEITQQVIRRAREEVSVQLARDGEEALEILSVRDGRRPQLILLDLRLPGFDGWEILRRLKNDAELAAIPVAVLTGQRESMLESLRSGGNMYFIKPITERDAASLFPAIDQYWAALESLTGGADEYPAR